ncbi:MAG: tetratricopeptide repeat protein [Deltaproteobacteria bacterium]|nr:tetratricopeptide repeat protein [Deltaproteobacteria bacterium]
MDDEIPNGVWRLDESTRVALRLEAVRKSIAQRAFEAAMLEAEELLDESPDQPDALFLLGEASLELGQPEVALEAYQAAMRNGAAGFPPLIGLALAWYDLGRMTEAADRAREAVALVPADAEAHHVLGLALERLDGRESEAVVHLGTAHRLDPERYPFPLKLRPVDWERAYTRALLRVHPDVAEFWQGIPVRWEDFPSLEEIATGNDPIRPTVGGLYVGAPPEHAEPWEVRPPALRLFKRNLARAPTREDLVEDLAAVLVNEALDWLGWTESDLEDR